MVPCVIQKLLLQAKRAVQLTICSDTMTLRFGFIIQHRSKSNPFPQCALHEMTCSTCLQGRALSLDILILHLIILQKAFII